MMSKLHFFVILTFLSFAWQQAISAVPTARVEIDSSHRSTPPPPAYDEGAYESAILRLEEAKAQNRETLLHHLEIHKAAGATRTDMIDQQAENSTRRLTLETSLLSSELQAVAISFLNTLIINNPTNPEIDEIFQQFLESQGAINDPVFYFSLKNRKAFHYRLSGNYVEGIQILTDELTLLNAEIRKIFESEDHLSPAAQNQFQELVFIANSMLHQLRILDAQLALSADSKSGDFRSDYPEEFEIFQNFQQSQPTIEIHR